MSNKLRKPPKLAEWMLNRMSVYLMFGSLGDFEEDFNRKCESTGRVRATLWYWSQILFAFPGYFKLMIAWHINMYLSNCKVFARNMKRHKGFSLINVSGLALGMACCIFLLLWVDDELSFNRFHENIDSLYRVVCVDIRNDNRNDFAVTPAPMINALKEQFPEIERATMFGRLIASSVKYNDKKIVVDEYAFVDKDFSEMFTFPLLKGIYNPEDLYSVVITEKAAGNLFEGENPIGQSLLINNQFTVKVTGILENIPSNSSIQFDYLSPFNLLLNENYGKDAAERWDRFAFSSYIQIEPNISLEDLNEKAKYLISNYLEGSELEIYFQSFAKVYLHSSNIPASVSKQGNIQTVYIFMMLAAMILLIAIINFINLVTARASSRAKEVGVRKVIGASKTDIISQFFSESMMLSFLSLFVSLIVVYLFLPMFNNLSSKVIEFSTLMQVKNITGLLSIVFITGLLSGGLPSYVIASFQPVRIMKGMLTKQSKKHGSRTVLVVLQLSLSIILIISAFFLNRQIQFINDKDLGYNRSNMLSLKIKSSMTDQVEVLKSSLKALSNVESIASSYSPVIRKTTRMGGLDWEGREEGMDVKFNVDFIDFDYLNTLQMEMVEGRGYSAEFLTDSTAYVINEEAARQMGLENPIGKTFTVQKKGPIIGVVKDFVFDRFNNPIEPLLFMIDPKRTLYVHLRYSDLNTIDMLTAVEDVWNTVYPDSPFQYNFVDDSFKSYTRSERKFSSIFQLASLLSVFISCIGLIGLASFISELNRKEIGIRKVLGASKRSIMALVMREFVKWTLYAEALAIPIAWYAISSWLENYAYKSDMSVMPFIYSGIIILFTALITVSYHTIKAVQTNPVNAIKVQ